MFKQDLVSVIIPTLNSAFFLKTCIDSIKKQSYPEYEIIVVDDGSTDSTPQIATSLKTIFIKNTKKGRAEAKNLGLFFAKGKYVLFLDSDMELSYNVLQECIKLMNIKKHIGGIVIPECSIGDSYWVRVRNFERMFYYNSIIESARFFPIELVRKVNGFEEGIIFFEEATLPVKINKLGYIINARTNSLIGHHEENFNLYYWLKKKYNYGKTMGKYKQKYNEYLKTQMNVPYRIKLFTNNFQKFVKKPDLAIGIIILKFLDLLASEFGHISFLFS